MRSSSGRHRESEEREWPIFPIGPLLESYGGEPCQEDTNWRMYKCPFHNERTPSASVNTTLQIFVCHSCGVKGNAVQCVMKHEGLKYGDALKRTEEVAGKSDTTVHGVSTGSRRVSSRSGNRAGSRSFRRTWRSS